MTYNYRTKGVCSKEMHIELNDDHTIKNLHPVLLPGHGSRQRGHQRRRHRLCHMVRLPFQSGRKDRSFAAAPGSCGGQAHPDESHPPALSYQAASKAGLEIAETAVVSSGITAVIVTDYNVYGKLQYICNDIGVDIMDTDFFSEVTIKIDAAEEKAGI